MKWSINNFDAVLFGWVHTPFCLKEIISYAMYNRIEIISDLKVDTFIKENFLKKYAYT